MYIQVYKVGEYSCLLGSCHGNTGFRPEYMDMCTLCYVSATVYATTSDTPPDIPVEMEFSLCSNALETLERIRQISDVTEICCYAEY